MPSRLSRVSALLLAALMLVTFIPIGSLADERPLIEAFRNFLWSDEAQKAFVKNHFRSVTNESFNDTNGQFAKIEMPFTKFTLAGECVE